MPLIHDDATLRNLLAGARVIAIVGHSANPARPSYQIAAYLRQQGYTVYPVNPTVPSIDDHQSYPSLADLPEPVDIVDVFRRAEHLPGVVEEAIEAGAKAVWGQLGVTHPRAAQIAEEAGIDLVMDRCIKIEHRRLLG